MRSQVSFTSSPPHLLTLHWATGGSLLSKEVVWTFVGALIGSGLAPGIAAAAALGAPSQSQAPAVWWQPTTIPSRLTADKDKISRRMVSYLS